MWEEGGMYWMRENNWLLQQLKSEKKQICFPCMHAAAAKRQNSSSSSSPSTTSLSLLSLTSPPPLTSTQKPHTSGDCHRIPTISCTGPLTTLYLRLYQRNDIRDSKLLVFEGFHAFCVLQRSCQKFNLWNICHSNVCRCTPRSLSRHNRWSNNGRQAKARKRGEMWH